jgi:opacity protein-like surface antigen
MGEGMSPIGFQWNFLPRRKLQPILEGHVGYMYSTQAIPVVSAGSFNFTLDVGTGFEYFRTKSSSVRVTYRYHHISNHGTASENPGVDNGVIQAAWVFGR